MQAAEMERQRVSAFELTRHGSVREAKPAATDDMINDCCQATEVENLLVIHNHHDDISSLGLLRLDGDSELSQCLHTVKRTCHASQDRKNNA